MTTETEKELEASRKIAIRYATLMFTEISIDGKTYESVMYALRQTILIGTLVLKTKYKMTNEQISENLMALEELSFKDISALDVEIDEKTGDLHIVRKSSK